MKLPFPIIACALYVGLTVSADQVTTRNGSILVGKAQITNNNQVQIAGQTLPAAQVQRIAFESNALQPGLSGVTFSLYQGNWNALPDFTQLSIDKSGTMSTNRLDLSPLELDGANRIFQLNHGDALDRWSAPPIEGRPRGGIHRAAFFSGRKQQLMRHEIAVAFLVAFILHRAPGLGQHAADPILHRARFGLGGKFLRAVRRHFAKRHRLQHARPQLGLFAIARRGLELIDTNLSLLLVRSMARHTVGLEKRLHRPGKCFFCPQTAGEDNQHDDVQPRFHFLFCAFASASMRAMISLRDRVTRSP